MGNYVIHQPWQIHFFAFITWKGNLERDASCSHECEIGNLCFRLVVILLSHIALNPIRKKKSDFKRKSGARFTLIYNWLRGDLTLNMNLFTSTTKLWFKSTKATSTCNFRGYICSRVKPGDLRVTLCNRICHKAKQSQKKGSLCTPLLPLSPHLKKRTSKTSLSISPPVQEKPITMFIFSTFDRWK